MEEPEHPSIRLNFYEDTAFLGTKIILRITSIQVSVQFFSCIKVERGIYVIKHLWFFRLLKENLGVPYPKSY